MNYVRDYILIDEATSTGDSAVLSVADEDVITLAITGTATSLTLEFVGEIDGNYLPIAAIDKATFDVVTEATSLDKLYVIDVSTLKTFKIVISAISGGNVTVNGRTMTVVTR